MNIELIWVFSVAKLDRKQNSNQYFNNVQCEIMVTRTRMFIMGFVNIAYVSIGISP